MCCKLVEWGVTNTCATDTKGKCYKVAWFEWASPEVKFSILKPFSKSRSYEGCYTTSKVKKIQIMKSQFSKVKDSKFLDVVEFDLKSRKFFDVVKFDLKSFSKNLKILFSNKTKQCPLVRDLRKMFEHYKFNFILDSTCSLFFGMSF